jgi:hypothetical protein
VRFTESGAHRPEWSLVVVEDALVASSAKASDAIGSAMVAARAMADVEHEAAADLRSYDESLRRP